LPDGEPPRAVPVASPQGSDVPSIVEAPFAAWTANKPREARAQVADDLTFMGPNTSYDSAAQFWPAKKSG
jgi:hypothetical protein